MTGAYGRGGDRGWGYVAWVVTGNGVMWKVVGTYDKR